MKDYEDMIKLRIQEIFTNVYKLYCEKKDIILSIKNNCNTKLEY